MIDGRYVITGSFKWTVNAERRNRENLVILNCPEGAQTFSAEWVSNHLGTGCIKGLREVP